VFDRQTDMALVNLKIINDACGDKIDVVYTCGTDFAHQNGQFCGQAVFRDVWMPYYRKVNDWIHACLSG
jgi:hypothetical protein